MLAERDVPVLIYGESGTGKELFARAIHNASERSENSFIALNCGAFPSELVDFILFGHVRGSFTGAVADKNGVFAQADGGTLFLDEFGELEPFVQVRLLRVLQDGSYTPVGSPESVNLLRELAICPCCQSGGDFIARDNLCFIVQCQSSDCQLECLGVASECLVWL
jgi:transcriptional regulator with PAS, ATPase and Fis domain